MLQMVSTNEQSGFINRIMTASMRAVTEAGWMKIRVENRHHQIIYCLLNDSIPNSWDAKLSNATIIFGYFYPSDGLRSVLLGFEFKKKLIEVNLQVSTKVA